MNALVKKQQISEGSTVESGALLSNEVLNSLLVRFKMIMQQRMKDRKYLLRNFLVEKNLNFLQDYCAPSIQELVQLAVFFDLPLNFLPDPLNLTNVSLVQFMFEIKKRQIANPPSTDFILNLWNLLSN